jgi:hypothetical protein
MSLRFAQVVHIYPNLRVAELVMTDNGQRFSNVPYLSGYVSSDSGTWMAHATTRPGSEQAAGGLHAEAADRSIIAACLFEGGRPVILGFMAHPLTQMAFVHSEANRDVYRHPAGVVATVGKDGSLEIQHTGAAYLRIGTGIEHEDLTPLSANKNWVLPLNDQPTITLSNNLFRLVIEPAGSTEILSDGSSTETYRQDESVTFGGNSTTTVRGSSTYTAGMDIRIRTPANVQVTAGKNAIVQAAEDSFVYAGSDVTVSAGDHVNIAAGADATVVASGNVAVGAGGDAMIGAAGDVTIGAGGDVSVGAAGSATVGAMGSASLEAMGSVSVSAAGTATVSCIGPMTLAAPEITALCTAFIVTGHLVELHGAGAGFGGYSGAGLSAVSAGGVATGLSGTARSAANPQVSDANSTLSKAQTAISEAVQKARDSSDRARGTGSADNQGRDGAPASDVPV